MYIFFFIDFDLIEFFFFFYSIDQEDVEFIIDFGVVSENIRILILFFDIIKGFDRELRLEVKFGGIELKV